MIWILYPKPTQLNAEMEENDQNIKRPDRHYQSRALRWSDVKQNRYKKLIKVIDIEKNFIFRLYTFTQRDNAKTQLYAGLRGSTN